MRLQRSDPASPGLRRHRRGKGFRYLTADGEPVRDPETLERIEKLVIPPAWRRVWICPREDGHIQAVGVDDAGRKQYLYHPRWRAARDEEKHDRVLALARILPAFRAAVTADLDAKGTGRERVLAVALRILDLGVFRTGGEEYAAENGTHGVATLLREHVTVRGDELRFAYPAKGGQPREVRIRDGSLAVAVRALRRRTGADRLLAYRQGRGWHEVRSDDVNERFKELTGPEYTAKDLRTWTATVLAAASFAEYDPPSSERGRQRIRARVMREVAEQLGNTPAVTRRSYVDPRVVRRFADGRTIRPALRRIERQRLDGDEEREAIERAVIRLLTSR
ncbi:DNA topoisomerase IB [Amycolatopsis suaedae]|uniref:DNA topoisomerase n=1 Tax=Amycolatopsis suaedae TaxID=2510978 RepID=A0A4V2EL68_9PSEU|nr:DNA topoisomerase IB [Amycolatopsis suaedae]RZQ60515.1 DNA topoisomerase IB [Amycolatopsis suaedae]